MPFFLTRSSHPLNPLISVPRRKPHTLKFFGENTNELFKYACFSVIKSIKELILK